MEIKIEKEIANTEGIGAYKPITGLNRICGKRFYCELDEVPILMELEVPILMELTGGDTFFARKAKLA